MCGWGAVLPQGTKHMEKPLLLVLVMVVFLRCCKPTKCSRKLCAALLEKGLLSPRMLRCNERCNGELCMCLRRSTTTVNSNVAAAFDKLSVRFGLPWPHQVDGLRQLRTDIKLQLHSSGTKVCDNFACSATMLG